MVSTPDTGAETTTEKGSKRGLGEDESTGVRGGVSSWVREEESDIRR
jgi:hypothetical protein